MELACRTLTVVLMVAVIKTGTSFNIKDAIRISRDIDITISQDQINQNLDEVPGAEQCDDPSPSTFLQLRTDCDSVTTGICEIPGDGSARSAQLEFKVGNDLDQLGAWIEVSIEDSGETTIFNGAINDSAVESGETYLLSIMMSAQPQSGDQTVTIKIELYDASTPTPGPVQLCVTADFEVVGS